MARLGKVPKRKGNKDPTTSVSVSSEKTDKILMCGVALLCLSVAGLVCDAMLLIVMPSLCVFAVAGVVGNAMLIDHAFQRNEKGPGTLLILQIIGNAMLIIFTLQRPGSGPGIRNAADRYRVVLRLPLFVVLHGIALGRLQTVQVSFRHPNFCPDCLYHRLESFSRSSVTTV